MGKSLLAHIRKSDKAAQTLIDHLIQTSAMAECNAGKIGLQETGEVLGLLHDIGKASSEFQNYILSANGAIDPDCDDYVDSGKRKGKIDHSSAGAQYVYHLMAQHGKNGETVGQLLALCLASHHSGLIDCLSPDGVNILKRRLEKNSEITHLNETALNLQTLFESKINDTLLQKIESQLVNKIESELERDENGKLLDSQETLTFKNGLLARYLFSCLIDADRLSTAGFESPNDENLRNRGEYTKWNVLLERLNKRINEFEARKEKNLVYEIRNRVSRFCLEFSTRQKGIFQLNVPTGGGKTLASLRFALNHAQVHQMDHIFYIVPFTSIIDQNAEEVRKILEDQDQEGNFLDKVILEHHSNLTPEEESYRHNLLAQNWDAPIIFTTQVQFLETFFDSCTRDVRRMHQLANSIIIFDEVQTLPVRCVQLFNLIVRFLVRSCGCSVVLCTATQPLLDKIIPKERSLFIQPENKIIAHEEEIYRVLKRVNVVDSRKPGGWDEEEIAHLAVEQLYRRGSLLTVVNTKASARSLFLALSHITDVPLYHLSTSMCPAHRLEVLKTVRQKLAVHEPVLCVSTQLIEAGVDLDFGCVIRYLAGLDSIVQAAGRCNRNGTQETLGEVFVVNPSRENLKRLKDIRKSAQVTERVWDEFRDDPDFFKNDLAGLQAMSRYYQYYFFERSSEMNYPITKYSFIGREDNLFDLLSTNNKSFQEYLRGKPQKMDSLPFKQAFASASRCFSVIDQITRGVVVPYKEEGKELINDLCSTAFLERHLDLVKNAQRYSVNLQPGEFAEMSRKHAIAEVQKDSGIYFLDEQYYDTKFGWSKEVVG